ncbi:MAG: IS1595 family transposase [Candidatus Babeliaceae bacterium]|jgi:transposase-like protein
MNLTTLSKKFNTKAKCIAYLEKLRWGKKPTCPFCGEKKHITKRLKTTRYHCNKCNSDFSVLVGTIFEDTRMPLPKWFQLITLILNAKKGISAKQLMRDVEIGYPTAWFAAMKIRCAMINHCNSLQHIVEMDETYVGGKPRKKYAKDDSLPMISRVYDKRGRGTKKIPVVGIVERDGDIVLKVIEKLTSKNLLAMLRDNVKIDKSIVITDDFRSYRKFDEVIEHLTIEHSKGVYSKKGVNTNTIEGFFSILKNSIRGQYVAISKKYLPFYLVQAQYIFNNRNFKGNLFEVYLKNAVQHEKSMINYKPKGDTKKIAFSKCEMKKAAKELQGLTF